MHFNKNTSKKKIFSESRGQTPPDSSHFRHYGNKNIWLSVCISPIGLVTGGSVKSTSKLIAHLIEKLKE